MDNASLKSFSIFNLVLKSVLIYFIAENTGSRRKIYNFSQLLNKFQITLPQIRDYPKRVITPLIESHCHIALNRFNRSILLLVCFDSVFSQNNKNKWLLKCILKWKTMIFDTKNWLYQAFFTVEFVFDNCWTLLTFCFAQNLATRYYVIWRLRPDSRPLQKI